MDEHQTDLAGNWQQMESAALTRQKLESLSSGELIKLADSYGIDIPDSLERVFIIGELLEADALRTETPEDSPKLNHGPIQTAVIPRQYNISYIEVIIRDPLWVFAFWEIKEQEKENYEKLPDFEGYCLRVIPLNANSAKLGEMQGNMAESFAVAIGPGDTARYLGLPQNRTPCGAMGALVRHYIVKLCAIDGGNEIPVAASLPFAINNGVSKDIDNLQKNPCISLSGISDFAVSKGTDRKLRGRKK